MATGGDGGAGGIAAVLVHAVSASKAGHCQARRPVPWGGGVPWDGAVAVRVSAVSMAQSDLRIVSFVTNLPAPR
jgi:hypothetical protein